MLREWLLRPLLEQGKKIMATLQEQHDQIVQMLGDVSTEIDALDQKITDLSNANPTVDFSDVISAVQALKDKAVLPVDPNAPTS